MTPDTTVRGRHWCCRLVGCAEPRLQQTKIDCEASKLIFVRFWCELLSIGGADHQEELTNETHRGDCNCCCILCIPSRRTKRDQRQIQHCTRTDGGDARS